MSDSEGGVPYYYKPAASILTAESLHATHSSLAAGESAGVRVSVAGRLMLRRVQGKICFGTLDDASGSRIQLFARAVSTADYEEFCGLSLGDWLGASGEVVRTRRGELSVAVEEWVLLAAARRPFPDKHHGLADADTRYRRRYVDFWVSPQARRSLLARSRLVASIRRQLDERGFVEVETPVLHPIPGGALARPFVTHHNALNVDFYLRVAPELYLKRLVVGGMQRVFEIGRVFRNEGLSPRHSPEFTMLELYEAYADYTDMMELVEQIISVAAQEAIGSTAVKVGDVAVELAPPWRRASMEELVEEFTGARIFPDTPVREARAYARELGVEIPETFGTGLILAEVYERSVEGKLLAPVFVCDFPVEVSPLARGLRGEPNLAEKRRGWPARTERFEAVVAGREIANAFTELTDPDEQRKRFEAQEKRRDMGDSEAMTTDEDYLTALEYGLPPTGGLGIGIDRLAMLVCGAENIRDVVAFPTLRPPQADSEESPGAETQAQPTEGGVSA